MANVGIYELTDTWNDGATTFAGIELDVTDTASAAASKLLDLQVGGASKFSVDKTGIVTLSGGKLTAGGSGTENLVAEFGTEAAGRNHQLQIWGNGAGRNHLVTALGNAGLQFSMGAGGAHCALITNGSPAGLSLSSNSAVMWASNSSNAGVGTKDTYIYRDAAGQIAIRNAENPQSLHVYNTYTDGSNYERGFARWNADVFEIGVEKAGTGADRAVSIICPPSKDLELAPSAYKVRVGPKLLVYGQYGGEIITTSDGCYAFSSRTSYGTAPTQDVRLRRDAAGTLALRNGANPQSFNIYNTDGSNYERAFLRWDAGVLKIGTEAAGTGTVGDVELTNSVIVLSALPTSDPVNAGQLWNDSGTLKVSAG